MVSQVDLDQGGTFRQWVRAYLGPSVGWIRVPLQNKFPISTGGTYFLDPSTNYVPVNSTSPVTIVLPPATNPSVGPQSQPELFADPPIVIVDVGGNASTTPITIQRNNPSETIMGLVSITISVNYGGYTLARAPDQSIWNSISP